MLRSNILFSWILLIGIWLNAKAQEDSIIFETILQNVGYFEWDADIDRHVSILQEWGIDTCTIIGLDEPITVGPSVSCESGNISPGMGYRWDKASVPRLAFFSIHFVDCETCSLSFRHTTKFGYGTRLNAEPSEVETLSRYFKKDSVDNVRIDVWNECCPGNRIKIFRVLNKPTKRKNLELKQDTTAEHLEQKKNTAAEN